MKSRIAVFSGPDKPFQLANVDVPELNPGEVLVRNEYVTLCRNDLRAYKGEQKARIPTILGHEVVGRIAAFGPKGPTGDLRGVKLKEGDRVTWSVYASIPAAYYTKIGIRKEGDRVFQYGREPLTPDHTLHGGLAEYAILRPNTSIIKVSSKVPLPVAAYINCAVATVAGTLRLAGSVRNRTVVISGVGMLGMIACALCRAAGAKWIVAFDRNEERLQMSKKFRADAVAHAEKIDYMPEGSVHCVLEFSGAPSAMEAALFLLSSGGVAVWTGATYPQRMVQINAESVVRNLLTIKGMHRYTPGDLKTAVIFMEKYLDKYPFEQLVDKTFPLVKVNDAFNHAINSNALRVGVKI